MCKICTLLIQINQFYWVGVKGARNINPAALTAITLLIAESDLRKKDQMVALVTTMLK